MNVKFLALICFAAFCAACSSVAKTEQPPANRAPEQMQSSAAAQTSQPLKTAAENVGAPAPANGVSPVKKDAFSEIKTTKADCLRVDTGDSAIQAAQTFPVDFAPFVNGCFVTTYNPEYDDPPMETEFAIYQDGAKVFDFPARFNGVEFGCWVEGVAFEDLNADGLKDVVVAGKCSAKTQTYRENMVYANTGSGFTTDENVNLKLQNFAKTKEIIDFARQNKEVFFK